VVTRWQVTKAVRASGLPAPARLVMLVLADSALVPTAVIPPEFTPSLSVLARETGLNESTVTRKLNELEDAGWVVRTRPTNEASRALGERTQYRLTVPDGVGAEDTDVDAGSMDGSVHSAPTLDAESMGGGRTQHPIKEEDRSSSDHSSDLPSSSRRKRAPKPEPHRPDVEKICNHLADGIVANGSKRPTITDEWRRQARLLLDEERRPPLSVDKVINLIDWALNDTFWRANIQSMPKFRAKYDQLRLKALEEHERGRSSLRQHRPYTNPTDPDAYSKGL
jgi:hypothetical protein